MKKLLQIKWLLVPMFFLSAVFSADAQVAYTQDFEAGLGGWSTGWTNQTSLPCNGLSSPRRNIYTVGTQGNFESPLLGTSNGGVITMSFAYKVTNWSAGTVATPATFGTINVQYAASATGPWTTVHTINSLNHTPDTLCNTVAVPNFTAPLGSMFMRFECIYGAGDYWMYFDDVTISQGAPPACVQPSTLTATSLTSTGATLGWTEIGTATAWDVEYGLFGFTQGAGTLATSASTSLAVSGLMGNTQYSFYVRSNCGVTGTSVWSGPFTFTTLCASQLSGIITINAGAPATATNFQSFSAFAAEINVCGIGGPLTVNVVANSGPYTERLVLNQIAGASATNTITMNGNGNTLTFEALNTTDRATILLNGTDFLTVNNLKVAGTSVSWAHAVHLINGADNNTFSNCEFIVSTEATTSFVSSIALSGSLTSATTAGNTGSNNTFINNLHKGGYYGITLMGPSTTVPNVGNKVLNSTFEDYYFYGVYISNQEDAEIVNNDISRATRATVSTFYGIGFFGTNPGTLISRNSIHDNLTAVPTNTSAAYPIYASSGAGTLVKPMNIINNEVYNIKGNGIVYGAYFLTNTFFVNFYHNSIVLDNTSQTGTSAIAGVYHTGLATGFDMKNNIIHINNGNTGIKRVLWFSNTAPAFTSNNNVLFNASTTGTNHLVTRGTTNFATLALWQASNGSIYDQSSVSANAVFTNAGAGNLRPLSAAVDNIGTPLGITTDITGAARSATTPDAGAYEFAPVSSDISLTAGALIRDVCYSANDTVSLTITNIIGAPVDLAVNPITATWMVNGPTNSNGSIVFNSGTLASGASMTMKASGVSMPSGGTYSLSAYIAPNSVNTVPSNDTISNISINVSKLIAATPTNTIITNTTDSVELKAFSAFFPNGGFFITEVCHFRGATVGNATPWPAYLLADDYIEITGAPFSDLGGITLEQWSTTALQSTYTFPSGTFLNANGTAIIAVGEFGSSVPSPANNYYHITGFTSSFGSTTSAGRILKDGIGNILDAVGYSGSTTVAYTFPAIANVGPTDWSATILGGGSTAGIRLEGPDQNSGTGWLVSSATNQQNPNAVNNLVTVPTAPPVSGFNWNLNGTSVSTNTSYFAGPFTTSGTYKYVAAYNSTTCGMIYDTATVVVQLPSTSLQGQIGFGTTVSTTTLYTPVYRFSSASASRFNRSLTIYTQAEMIAAGIVPGSTIEKLAFDKAGTGATNGTNRLTLNMWMGASNKTAPLAAQDWATSIQGKSQVFADTNVTIPATSGWVEFTLTTPYVYQGGTLEIAFENAMTGASPFSTDKFDWKYDAALGTTHNIGNVSAGATFATTNLASSTLYSWRPNTLFTFQPGIITCPSPIAFSATGVTSNSANLGWTAQGSATNWTVAYGPVGFNPSVASTNLAAWNFNGPSTTTIPGGTTAPTPFIGTGTASLVGGTTAAFATYAVSGNSSDTTQGVPPNYAWNTSTYAAQGTGDRTRGIQFNVSTVGRTNISFTYDLRLSPTAASTWVVQYSTDVTAATPVWVDAMVYTAPCAECWNRQITANFSGITALENNANAGFRVVAAFVPGTSTYASANVGGSYAATGTARFDMVRVISVNAGGGTQLVTNVNPFLLTGLQSNTSYHAYVRSNCGTNDTSFWVGPIAFTTAFQCPPNAICETFAAGNGSVELNTATTGASLSPCPTSVTIAVPAGSAIASMDVDYSMTAFNGAWLSEQRSRVYSPTTVSGEATITNGPAISSAGTQAYARTGLTFANGATGNVVVQLHAFRTWGGVAPSCDTIYQYVNNNTFRVIAYLAPAAACPAPTALTSSNITSTSIQVNWNGTASGYRVQYGPTGFVPGTGTVVTTSADSLVVSGLMSNTAYDFWVMALCSGTDSSTYTGPITATTLCGVFPLTFTETFETSSTSLSCWQVGANWALWPVGGFGNSATSVRFPFYSVSSGSFDAFTPTFTPTTAGDQLSFDHAYATYDNEVDSVIISYSTDGGATYNLLVGLNGGPTGTMTTAPPQTGAFIPTATQWSNFSIPVPAGTNKIRFTAKTAFGNNFYADNVKVGPAPLALQPFALISPPNNATLMVAGSAQTPINVSWQRAGAAPGIIYQWRAFAPGGSVNAPILTFPSNMAGTDTNLTLSVAAVDAVLASLGVNIGDTATIQWSVRATLGTDSLFATTPFTLNLVRVGVATPQLVAAPQYAVSPGTTGNAPNGQAATSFYRAAQIILPGEYAAANVNSGDGIRSVGFTLNVAATAAVTGIMKVYLVNSTDASYLKSTNWDTIISNMTLVHSDTITIPVGATQYTMSVNQNFVYTGGSMYLAYDWQQTSAPIATGLVYRSNTLVPNSIRRQGSTVAPPATLAGTSAFRLETLWGIDRPADDLEVIAIFAKGRNALTYGTPEQVDVIVRNNGYLTANKNVTLTATGANAFVGTVNVNLASTQTTTVTFNYTPTVTGVSTLTASVPADDVSANNTQLYVQEATTDKFRYADTAVAGLGAVGFNAATGLLLTKYDVIGARTVTQVVVRISDNAATAGNDVYAVVLDSSGAIVGQSAITTLTAADLSTWKTFTIPTTPLFTNESFYVGLAQTAGLAGYFPVAFKTETPTRPNAFFSAAIAGTGIAAVNNFRLYIEAVLGTPPACPDPTQVAVAPDCIEADVTWTSSASAISSTIQYGPAGFTPGTGTIVTGVSSPYTITGLTAGTAYDVWVKDSCATAAGQYVGPVTFTTLSAPNVTASSTFVSVTPSQSTWDFNATNAGGPVTTWSWTFGDGGTANTQQATHNYLSNGTYTATVTAVGPCGTSTSTTQVVVTQIGIESYALNASNLYPNPSAGLFQIVGLPSDGGEISVEISSSTGAVVMRAKVEVGAETKEIDMRGFAPGVYQVRLSNQNGVAVKPFVLRN